MMSSRWFFLFLTVFALLMSGTAHALDVQNVRVGNHPDKTRIVIELTEAVDYKAFLLSNPYRFTVDLPQFIWQAGTPEAASPTSVTDIRYGTHHPGISRIVFDLGGPHKVTSAFYLPPSSVNANHRLVFDISKASLNEFSDALHQRFGTLESDDIPQMGIVETDNTPAAPAYKKPIIIIDAGHGGNDPGAVSPQKILEKNITLAMSKELKAALEKSGKYEIKLTRDSDHYVKLRDRVALARKWNGDLFISIHADSIEKRNVRGASIYTLSDKSSDTQTAKLAARENRSDIIAGVDLTHEDQAVANILIDLASTHTKNQSRYFANLMVDSFKDQNVNILPNTHRYAGFAVLKAPDIPSILIEAGFLSNRKEAELLATKSYRARIITTIQKGIDNYFTRLSQSNL